MDINKVLELIEFPSNSHQLEVLQRFADGEDGNIERDSVLAENFLNQILMSEDLAPVNALNRWVAASRELDGRYKMLESLQENIQAIIA